MTSSSEATSLYISRALACISLLDQLEMHHRSECIGNGVVLVIGQSCEEYLYTGLQHRFRPRCKPIFHSSLHLSSHLQTQGTREA